MKKRLPSISKSDYIDDALDMIQERDFGVVTAMSGDSEPTEGVARGMLFNNTTKEELSYFETDNWKTLVTYKNGVYSKNIVDSKLQPLSPTLTSVSQVSIRDQISLLTFNSSHEVSYFSVQNLMNNVSKEIFLSAIGVGKLAYNDKITGGQIKELSVSSAKMAISSPITPPIHVGDIVYCSSEKEGYVKIKEGYTIGASNATYSGEKYKELYKLLWENSSFQLINTSGSTESRGSNYEVDWESNKLIKLKRDSGFHNIIKIQSSTYVSAFLTSDNVLYVTGDIVPSSTFVPFLTDVVDFETTTSGVIAIKKDKSIWGMASAISSESMGGAPRGKFGEIGRISTALSSPKIYTDSSNTFIVNGGKVVLYCGRNVNGELGNGTATSVKNLVSAPNQVPFNDVSKMKIGGPTMILTSTGDLYICGPNQYGQQGNGTKGTSKDDILSFVKRASNVKDIAGSFYVSAYLGKDGSAYATGWNDYRAILSVDDNIEYVTSFSRIYKNLTLSDYIKIYIVSHYASIMIRNEATGSMNPLTMSGWNKAGMFGSGDFSAGKIVGKLYNIANDTDERLGFIPDEIRSTENADCLYFYNHTKKELWASGTNNSSSWGKKGVSSSTTPVRLYSNVEIYDVHAHRVFIYTTDGRLLAAGSNSNNVLGFSSKYKDKLEQFTDIEELTELTPYIKY